MADSHVNVLESNRSNYGNNPQSHLFINRSQEGDYIKNPLTRFGFTAAGLLYFTLSDCEETEGLLFPGGFKCSHAGMKPMWEERYRVFLPDSHVVPLNT